MRIIGLTGGMGSGKSTVSGILRGLGAKIIDADTVAREVVAVGEKALEELVCFFGPEILDGKQGLDRKKLAAMAFGDGEKLSVLNSITHKYIIERIEKEVDNAAQAGVETVVIDAAIPFERGFLDIAGEIWVVTAALETRISRVMRRSGFTCEEAAARIRAQKSEEEYVRLADVVLENNGEYSALEERVTELYKRNYR